MFGTELWNTDLNKNISNSEKKEVIISTKCFMSVSNICQNTCKYHYQSEIHVCHCMSMGCWMAFSLTQFQRAPPSTRPDLTCSNGSSFKSRWLRFSTGTTQAGGHECDFSTWKRWSMKRFFAETIPDRKRTFKTCDISKNSHGLVNFILTEPLARVIAIWMVGFSDHLISGSQGIPPKNDMMLYV